MLLAGGTTAEPQEDERGIGAFFRCLFSGSSDEGSTTADGDTTSNFPDIPFFSRDSPGEDEVEVTTEGSDTVEGSGGEVLPNSEEKSHIIWKNKKNLYPLTSSCSSFTLFLFLHRLFSSSLLDRKPIGLVVYLTSYRQIHTGRSTET